MNWKTRIGRLADDVRGIASRQAIAVGNCKGLGVPELMARLDAAMPPDSEAIAADLEKQIEEYKHEPRVRSNGDVIDPPHGFVVWLLMLVEGFAMLPERIPRVVLLAWRDGHANHPAKASPIPLYKCLACGMALPNATPSGWGRYCFASCPVCQSNDLAIADLSASMLGERWRPIPKRKGRLTV